MGDVVNHPANKWGTVRMEPVRVYLSRRNLLTLLRRLDLAQDAKDAGLAAEAAAVPRTIIKRDSVHPEVPQTHAVIYVTAVEDVDYYKDRAPGEVAYAPDGPGWDPNG